MSDIAQSFLSKRVGVLHGQAGMGVTSCCHEFGHHFSMPGGRLFSSGVFYVGYRSLITGAPFGDVESIADHFARVIFMAMHLDEDLSQAVTQLSGFELWNSLFACLQGFDSAGPWLLVVDELDFTDAHTWRTALLETLKSVLARILAMAPSLRLLFGVRTSESGILEEMEQWTKLDGSNALVLKLHPLPHQNVANIFLRHLGRRLHSKDFDESNPQQKEISEKTEALQLLQGSPLLPMLGGVPGNIVCAAMQVERGLPSMLQHPALGHLVSYQWQGQVWARSGRPCSNLLI